MYSSNVTAHSSRLRRNRWLAWLILPLLLSRALVPAGFMLAAADGSLAVVLCESGPGHAVHAGHGHHHPGRPHASDPTCPFAQSAGAAPLPTLPALAAQSLAPTASPVAAREQRLAPSGPARQHTARAPPRFA